MEPGLISLVVRLARTIHRHSSEAVLGINLRSFVVLSYVAERGSVPQQQLADVMCLDANSTVLLLNELDEAGLIDRRRDPTDRRRHLIELTQRGREAFSRGEMGRESIEDEVLANLTADERATLAALIGRSLAAPSRAAAA